MSAGPSSSTTAAPSPSKVLPARARSSASPSAAPLVNLQRRKTGATYFRNAPHLPKPFSPIMEEQPEHPQAQAAPDQYQPDQPHEERPGPPAPPNRHQPRAADHSHSGQ